MFLSLRSKCGNLPLGANDETLCDAVDSGPHSHGINRRSEVEGSYSFVLRAAARVYPRYNLPVAATSRAIASQVVAR